MDKVHRHHVRSLQGARTERLCFSWKHSVEHIPYESSEHINICRKSERERERERERVCVRERERVCEREREKERDFMGHVRECVVSQP